MKHTIGIVGYGYVGKAFERFFSDRYEVRVYDPAYGGGTTKEKINECDLAVICVPTPPKEDGSCDVSIVEESVGWLATPLILIKSTVQPGTTERLSRQYGKRICFSPEYMGEGTYFTPFWKYPHPSEAKMHGFFVVGGPEPECAKIVDIFLRIMGPDTRVIKVSPTEAEIVKYMENSWGAAKVTFANEFYEICRVFGADFQKVREGFLADGRVERMHTMVLLGSRGFGGKCFPKDISGIIHAAHDAGYEAELLKQVMTSNETFVAKNQE